MGSCDFRDLVGGSRDPLGVLVGFMVVYDVLGLL